MTYEVVIVILATVGAVALVINAIKSVVWAIRHARRTERETDKTVQKIRKETLVLLKSFDDTIELMEANQTLVRQWANMLNDTMERTEALGKAASLMSDHWINQWELSTGQKFDPDKIVADQRAKVNRSILKIIENEEK